MWVQGHQQKAWRINKTPARKKRRARIDEITKLNWHFQSRSSTTTTLDWKRIEKPLQDGKQKLHLKFKFEAIKGREATLKFGYQMPDFELFRTFLFFRYFFPLSCWDNKGSDLFYCKKARPPELLKIKGAFTNWVMRLGVCWDGRHVWVV